ncbi:MAG: hypothetical protein [Cressdnaviricota sp.]|nr:MAG: hypothetical protein [Cressdnaviricota sp.]
MAPFYEIALRIDKGFDDCLAWLDRRSESGFCVREYADSGEHYHAYILSALKPTSFRVVLKREVDGLAGNGCYSVSEVKDVDKYVRYICKGDFDGSGVDVVWKCGLEWTDERIYEAHVDYWSSNRSTKLRRLNGVLDYVTDECKAEGIAWDDRRTIAEKYIRELVARSKPINLYSVKSSVNLVQTKLCPTDEAIKCLAEKVDL